MTPDYYRAKSNPPVDLGERVGRPRHIHDQPGILVGGLTDIAPYWETKGGRLHRVASAMIVWDGDSMATWERPRVHVDLRCKALPPSRTDLHDGLRVLIPASSLLCDKCFYELSYEQRRRR